MEIGYGVLAAFFTSLFNPANHFTFKVKSESFQNNLKLGQIQLFLADEKNTLVSEKPAFLIFPGEG